MITKKQFIKYMNEFQHLEIIEDEITKAFRKLSSDFNQIHFGRYIDLISSILKDTFNDKNDWISYWIYDLEFGKKYEPNSVTMNKKPIKMKTAGDLYDVLMENLKRGIIWQQLENIMV